MYLLFLLSVIICELHPYYCVKFWLVLSPYCLVYMYLFVLLIHPLVNGHLRFWLGATTIAPLGTFLSVPLGEQLDALLMDVY